MFTSSQFSIVFDYSMILKLFSVNKRPSPRNSSVVGRVDKSGRIVRDLGIKIAFREG